MTQGLLILSDFNFNACFITQNIVHFGKYAFNIWKKKPHIIVDESVSHVSVRSVWLIVSFTLFYIWYPQYIFVFFPYKLLREVY